MKKIAYIGSKDSFHDLIQRHYRAGIVRLYRPSVSVLETTDNERYIQVNTLDAIRGVQFDNFIIGRGADKFVVDEMRRQMQRKPVPKQTTYVGTWGPGIDFGLNKPTDETEHEEQEIKRSKNETCCTCGVWTIQDNTIEMHSDWCKLRRS